MLQTLAKILLAPILLKQGRAVRRTAARLPEAAGKRVGGAGTGQKRSLLIVGDSAAAGVGVSTQQQALSGQLVERLSANMSLRWRLLAQSGRTTLDTVQAVEQDTAEQMDWVVVSLGVNDVTAGLSTRTWLRQQTQLLEVLRRQYQPNLILLTCVPPMHAFPALPQPLRWFLGRQARLFNRALCRQVADEPDCRFVAPDFPLTASYIAQDGFHPNEKAYALWAEQLCALLH